ncbi:MAG: hypothetical protein ACJ79O_19555, partial [Myxococcales bacterium]
MGIDLLRSELKALRSVPLLLCAAACGSSSVAPGPSSLTLTVSPASLTVAAGAIATATVTAVRADPNGAAIALEVQGIPEGVAVNAPAIASGATLSLVSFRNQCAGNSVVAAPVTIRGTSGGSTAVASFSLSVQCAATGALELSILAGAPGGPGYADDDGSDARFADPFSVVADGAGSLYVADTFNNSIRKVAISSGAVTTVAGSRSRGFADGPGTAAEFDAPFAIALDGDALYVADTFNHLIRRIDLPTGSVTTIAGVAGEEGASDGPTATAHFNTPSGIAAVGGHLFVADSGNDTIRRIDLATAMVSTLAGSAGAEGNDDGVGSLARFVGPTGIVADGEGNLFVTDSFNHTIRRIEIESASVSTFSGAAGEPGTAGGVETARFNFPTGIAIDGGGNLYVADTVNLQIRSVAIATRDVVTIAGVTAPVCQFELPNRLCFPHGLTVDGSALYIADTAAHRIRVLTDDGLGSVAGSGPHLGIADGSGRG